MSLGIDIIHVLKGGVDDPYIYKWKCQFILGSVTPRFILPFILYIILSVYKSTVEVHPGFYWGSCYSISSFMCMFCRSLFVLLYLFLLAIVLSVLLRYTDSDDLPLVSSNSSWNTNHNNKLSSIQRTLILYLHTVRSPVMMPNFWTYLNNII